MHKKFNTQKFKPESNANEELSRFDDYFPETKNLLEVSLKKLAHIYTFLGEKFEFVPFLFDNFQKHTLAVYRNLSEIVFLRFFQNALLLVGAILKKK